MNARTRVWHWNKIIIYFIYFTVVLWRIGTCALFSPLYDFNGSASRSADKHFLSSVCTPVNLHVCARVCVCVMSVCLLLEGVIASRQSGSSRKTGLEQQIRASSKFPPIKTTPVYLHLNNTRPLTLSFLCHPPLLFLSAENSHAVSFLHAFKSLFPHSSSLKPFPFF